MRTTSLGVNRLGTGTLTTTLGVNRLGTGTLGSLLLHMGSTGDDWDPRILTGDNGDQKVRIGTQGPSLFQNGSKILTTTLEIKR